MKLIINYIIKTYFTYGRLKRFLKLIKNIYFLKASFHRLDQRFEALKKLVQTKLLSQGINKNQIQYEYYLHMRYEGTDCALMCSPKLSKSRSVSCTLHGDFETSFVER